MSSMKCISLNLQVLLLSMVLLAGCNTVNQTELPETSQQVVSLLKDVSKEDTLTLYYLFGGCAEYIDRCGIESNKDAFELFSKVKTKYGKSDGWLDKDGEDNDINDLLEKKLADYKLPKQFDDESKQKFVKIFRDIELGILKAWRSK